MFETWSIALYFSISLDIILLKISLLDSVIGSVWYLYNSSIFSKQ